MNKLDRVLKALADANRLRILNLLGKQKMCVCELAFVLGVTQPSVSRHLKKLVHAGIVSSKQDGYWTNYFIKKPKNLYIKTLLKNLNAWVDNDPVIKKDLKKAKRANRLKVYWRKKGRGKI